VALERGAVLKKLSEAHPHLVLVAAAWQALGLDDRESPAPQESQVASWMSGGGAEVLDPCP